MKNVNELLVIWSDESVSFEETNEVVALVKAEGYKFSDPTGEGPAILKFEFEDDGISIEGLLRIVHKIDEDGKYEVIEFKFSTTYDDYYEEDPFAAINLMKKSEN